jgi:hypothetical protein
MPTLDLPSTLVILVALALGGLMKGATGAGAPVVAVPVIAAFFDARLAVAVMVTPNFFSNLWQLRSFASERVGGGFTLRFGLAGALGAIVGTAMLASLPEKALTLIMALAVVAYVALRLAHPDLRLADRTARRAVIPAGLAAGALQGAAGISAPVAISFLNAMRLPRPAFIATISAFFFVMSAVQMVALCVAGLLTPNIFVLSVVALAPLLAFMPVGSWMARRLSPEGFDRLLLAMLTLLALRLFQTVLF